MSKAQDLGSVKTRLREIGKKAKEKPDLVFTSLAHKIDIFWIWEALHLIRRDGAKGIDGVSWREVKANWETILPRLVEEFKSGSYIAPSLKRAYIPKADGSKRPIAIATVEDKVLQRAVAMALEAVYEQDFYPFSYGFRPGRSAHQAVRWVRERLQKVGGAWVLEVDIKGFFDNIDHGKLREILNLRVKDGVLRRAIDKWLKAGVLEDGKITFNSQGTPQGGVISPILANIYLHEVLDKWFVEVVKKRLRGKAEMCRFADDFIILFEEESDAKRVLDVIGKRFARYGLEIHPEKTRLLDFREPRYGSEEKPESFDFLGFTFIWCYYPKYGKWYITRRTSKKKFKKSLEAVVEKIKKFRHESLKEQHAMLSRSLRGYYGYYGIRGNSNRIKQFCQEVTRAWAKWLKRRGQKAISWDKLRNLLKRYPLPPARIVHMQV